MATQNPLQYTALRTIIQGYRDCGLIQDSALPNSDQLAVGLQLLTDMVNLWVTQGLKLWLTSDVTVPLTSGKSLYVLGPAGDVVMPRPLQIVEGYYMDANGVRRPLIPLSWDDWVRLSQVNQTGMVNSYFEDKQQTYTNLNLWLVPNATAATGTVHVIVRNSVTAPLSLTDSMNFPVEWYFALRWGLAAELSVGMPERIVTRCEANAGKYRQALDSWDVENAPTQFVPDARFQYQRAGSDFDA